MRLISFHISRRRNVFYFHIFLRMWDRKTYQLITVVLASYTVNLWGNVRLVSSSCKDCILPKPWFWATRETSQTLTWTQFHCPKPTRSHPDTLKISHLPQNKFFFQNPFLKITKPTSVQPDIVNYNTLMQQFCFLWPQELLLEAPLLHFWDFTVLFSTASTSHYNGHPSKC